MQYRLSILALIIANITPLIGVMFFGWNLFNVLILFWFENVVIGFYAILKMLRISPVGGIFTSLFFLVHYGLFMAVHVFILAGFFGPKAVPLSDLIFQNFRIVYLSFIAIFISHGISFVSNFLGKQEYLRTTVAKEMNAPYGRMTVLHLTLIFGGWLVVLLSSPIWLLVMLLFIKTAVDLTAHIKQHTKMASY
jgi:hypothetical protein